MDARDARAPSPTVSDVQLAEETLDALEQTKPVELSALLAAWADRFVDLEREVVTAPERRGAARCPRIERRRALFESYAAVVRTYARYGDDTRTVDAFRDFVTDVARHAGDADEGAIPVEDLGR